MASENTKQLEVIPTCFIIHGRMSLANGNPSVRIWRLGTKRILGVDGDEQPIIPIKLRKLLDWNTKIYADFEICPVTLEREGRMQMVRVKSATRVVVERQGEDGQALSSRILESDICDSR